MRVTDRCAELATVSDDPAVLVRSFASPAMARANAVVGGWMTEAGLDVHVDAAGNLVGHRAGTDPTAGTLLLGSHLDTVRDAGAFDGPLGVLVAIEALARRTAPLPFAVDVYGFSDEEGLQFGTTYLGSRAVAGTLDAAALAAADVDGVTVARALQAFEGGPPAARTGERLLGYVEVHMEQGPVLEAAGVPLGVVSAIAGATRAQVSFRGTPGHAGTVPMAGRRDALAAAAEWVLAVEHLGQAGRDERAAAPAAAAVGAAPEHLRQAWGDERAGLVATVGDLRPSPGAPNVIAGAATATLDVRHADDGVRAAAVTGIERAAHAIAARRGLGLDWRITHDASATPMDPALTGALRRAAGPDAPVLTSGAGHDAVALAALCPVAMLFVRCAGGVSHSPAEHVSPEDAEAAVVALTHLLEDLAWT